MHSKMDTPPTYSYVCTTAIFVKYNSESRFGSYDFGDKFYLTNLQVKSNKPLRFIKKFLF
jgi:hypothetical protein